MLFIQPGEEHKIGDCSNIGDDFKPFGNGPTGTTQYNSSCNPSLTNGCQVGDLTRKHDFLTIAGNSFQCQLAGIHVIFILSLPTSSLASPNPYAADAFFFTDDFLNLTAENPIINRSIAIYKDGLGMCVCVSML